MKQWACDIHMSSTMEGSFQGKCECPSIAFMTGRDEPRTWIYVINGIGMRQLWIFLWTQLAKDVGC